MNTHKIEIEIPEEFKNYMDKNEKNYGKKLKELLLFQFIKQDKISFGKAAEIMGISKIEYIQDLGELGIPYYDNDFSDVENDLNTLDNLLGGK